ncbi:MAG TPA: ParB/RepB/Spo0J family partition protein [Sphingomonas sp.]|uniref:ParB/RepB/Spo0J family partition protein n=1 Tax=Sphingomonas sp. TaxID=28214 RepID=UPI002ED9A059
MSTKASTTSKPRAAKSRTIDPSPAAPPPAAIVETIVQLVPLALLDRAPENVRVTRVAEDAAELADDIAAHGLLQSLIGYQDASQNIFPDGFTWIVGGGRRLAALGILRERGLIGDDYRVPVLVRGMDEAIELSLSENLARRDMSPADEFFAFEHLMRPGTIDAAGLAKRFGFTERYVKQRLRLAQLAPAILEALRDRKLTLDAAMAYATSQDRDLQLRVFAVHNRVGAWKSHDVDAIRRDLAIKIMTADSAVVRFIGLEAYEAAGGRYDDDLFANPLADNGRRLADSMLAKRLAVEKIQDGLVETVSRLNRDGAGINAGALIAPDLEVGYWQWTRPKPPAGFVEIQCQYDKEKRWNAARNCGAQVKGIVGLDTQGRLVLVDSVFFVDKDKAKEVRPPEPKREVYVAPTLEERQEAQRARDVDLWSHRLGLGGFEDTKFAGRAFWPQPYQDKTAPMIHPTLGAGHAVYVRLFVPQADADAQVGAAKAHLDEEQRARGALVQAEARTGGIDPADEQPAVIIADGETFYRWSDGFYADQPENDERRYIDAFGSLTVLLDGVAVVDRYFATFAEYERHRSGSGGANVDDPEAGQ